MPMVRDTGKLIGDQLTKKGLLTPEQLKIAMEKQRLTGRMLGDLLVELGFATEEKIAEALSEQLGIPYVDVSTYQIDEKALSLFPEELLREHGVIPLFKVDRTVSVAMVDPMNIRVTDRLRFVSHCEIEPMFGTRSSIQKMLEKYYGSVSSLEGVMRDIKIQETAGPVIKGAPGRPAGEAAAPRPAAGGGMASSSSSDQVTGLIAAAEKAPVVKLVDAIIKAAVDNRASDIHIEPEESATYIRYRIDGILYDVPPPPKNMEPAIISRIKIMGNMDIAERRLPQD